MIIEFLNRGKIVLVNKQCTGLTFCTWKIEEGDKVTKITGMEVNLKPDVFMKMCILFKKKGHDVF